MATDAVAPSGEATPSINANVETNAPTSEATPQAEAPIFSNEEATEIKKFLDNNGGLEKVKKTVTARSAELNQPSQASEPAPQPTAQNPTQPQPQQPVQAPAEPTQPLPKGFKTPTEIIAEVYNDRLQTIPEYEAIKDYIHDGTYIKDMEKMGMIAFDKNGNANDGVIRQFLDLKAKTIPAPATPTALTSTPIVEYTSVEGDITDMATAQKIYMEGSANPRFGDAEQFIKTHFNGPAPAKS